MAVNYRVLPCADGNVLKDQTIIAIAGKHGVSTAEVVVAWELAHGLVSVPSSTKRKKLDANSIATVAGKVKL